MVSVVELVASAPKKKKSPSQKLNPLEPTFSFSLSDNGVADATPSGRINLGVPRSTVVTAVNEVADSFVLTKNEPKF